MRNIDENLKEKFENQKKKIEDNIKSAKNSNLNKLTAILVNSNEAEEINGALIEWLFDEGYMVSVKKEEFKILTIQW